jgi:hypothetical protein
VWGVRGFILLAVISASDALSRNLVCNPSSQNVGSALQLIAGVSEQLTAVPSVVDSCIHSAAYADQNDKGNEKPHDPVLLGWIVARMRSSSRL